jgi:hypothetical protein
VLSPKVRDCREELKAQHICMALYGLQSLGDSPEARQLLAALLPKVENCHEELKAVEVLNAVFGLQGMGDSPELQQLIAALVPKVEECRGHIREQQLDDAMRILQSFPDCDSVRQLTSAFTAKVRSTRPSFYGPGYGGLPIAGMQSWEYSGVMQELMRTLEQEGQTVGFATPSSITSSTPVPTPVNRAPESLLAGEDVQFNNEEALDWLERFGGPKVTPADIMETTQANWARMAEAFAQVNEHGDATAGYFLPALPIAAPRAPPAGP